PVDRSHVDELARDLTAGRGVMIPDAVMFAETDGALVNGQHRIYAVIKSGVALRVRVWWNVTEDIIEAIDAGKHRSHTDHAKLQQTIANPKATTPRVEALIRCRYGLPGPFRHVDILPYYEALKPSFDALVNKAPRGGGRGAAAVGAALALAHSKYPEQTL